MKKIILLSAMKHYINGDRTKIESFFEDLRLIKSLKREITKIYKNNKYNLLLTRNILVTIMNSFPKHYDELIRMELDDKYIDIYHDMFFWEPPN